MMADEPLTFKLHNRTSLPKVEQPKRYPGTQAIPDDGLPWKAITTGGIIRKMQANYIEDCFNGWYKNDNDNRQENLNG